MYNNKRVNPYISVDAEEEIVISGIAGQFPNSDNIKEFQDNLFNKMDLGSDDHERWTNYIFDMPPRIGKINNLEKFDAEFFNISIEEAHLLDPGTRILLENTYAAIIDAGVNPAELQGTRTGVVTAITVCDTYIDVVYEKTQVAGLPILGCSKNMSANRISYWLNVTGPSYNVDTACSSSHFAMVEAYNLIRSGICDAAIVASINLCIHPFVTYQFYCLGVLSSNGYCKPYDEEGAGYMRSDAATVVYLQKAKDARRIYATFVYGKTNCDGFKEEGITFPSLDKQKMLLEEFYKECNVSPLELSYLEAHATGTLVGDPVELQAIDETLCIKRNFPLLIGSVKSNIGHSEASSGHCQIAKVLIAMETGIIPPTIHFKHPRKDLTAIIDGRVKIVTEPTKWKGGYIGLNAFGFGGANSHLLLKSNSKIKVNETNNDLPKLVVISGRTEEAVKIMLDDIQSRSIDVEYISLLHRLHSDNIKGHSYRGYIIAGSKIPGNAIIKRTCNLYTKRPICFIFSGIGSQYFHAGQALMEFPVFAKAIQKCDTVLKPYGICVTEILINKDKYILDNVVNLFVCLIGLQIGMVDLLISIDVTPDVIMGHSIGELVCGYADGCLTAEETIMLAYYIGLAFFKSKIVDGLMAEVNLDFKTMKNMCPSDIDIACYNSSHNYIVSGPTSSVRSFLANLQNCNISVKEISCGHVPFHSRYVEPARVKLLEYLKKILPQKASPSSKWLNMSNESNECFSISPNIPYLAKYYINNLLAPVVFSEAVRFIPNDAVTIEITSHDVLQYILNNSLNTTVTNVALYKYSQKPNVETFLHGVGELYNAGLQLQIANLYPEVKFPVSRNTPMISHLIRWDHYEDWYTYCYTAQRKLDIEEAMVTINLYEEEFIYMTGHVINRKNLLPATGYLFLIWQMVGWLRKQTNLDIPVVFKDVNFLRSTVLSEQKPVDLTLMIQKASCKFEIIEGDSVVVTGTVQIPVNIDDEKICSTFIDRNDIDEEEMNIKDIYKELKLRGYQYTGEFRGLRSASITGKNGHIAWTDNWVTFMDSMLHFMILGQNSRTLFIPIRIRKLVIDPKSHKKHIEKLSNEKKQVLVQNYKYLDVLISGGIEIHGLVATAISQRQNVANPVLEEYKFVAHRDLNVISLQDAIRMSVHVALECHIMINIKIIEFIENCDQVMPEKLNSLHVAKILDDLPQICYSIKVVANNDRFKDSLPDNISTMEFDKLTKSENCLMIIGFGILTKNRNDLYEQLLSAMMPKGFLLTLEELNATYDYSCLDKYGLKVILEKRTNDKTIILLRKIQNFKKNQHIVHVNNYEFSWVNKIKSFMNEENSNTNTRIIIVAEGDFECGLLGLVNCLQKESGGDIIRSIFIQDGDAPAFSLQESLYFRQLQLDLPINVLRSGIWGSYRHFPLSLLESKLVENAYVSQMVRFQEDSVQGDLSTLCWIQGISFNNKEEDLIRVVYSSINFRDVMIASGRLTIKSTIEQDNCLIGMEFVGFNKTGQRIMGMCPMGGITNIRIADKYLSWIIPDKWTMEDAATIPCVYSTCYYALYLSGKMKKDDKVLIHSGTGGVGQAAIHLALFEGCEVFTTVGSIDKRRFIRETFPSIPDDHIGNSRDTSFEQMIIQGTRGRGVDIVLNSLAEEKLQASVRCLVKGGRFLEIGKFDINSNSPLEIFAFSKGISFHGIFLDKFFSAKPESKTIIQNKLIEGLKNNAIKPLCRKVFQKDEIEAAFRYMAAGKHIGKIMIQVQKEDKLDAPILAHPRYYCLEHKCYIVIGGLGGFGLELINWLILRGARNLVLTSRTGIKNGYQQSRITLWQSFGVNVQIVIATDTSKYEDCKSILQFAEEQGPVDAIFNLAVVLKDDIFKNQSSQAFEESFISKAWTTKRIDELSRTICPQLRHFVVFSSVSCGRGNAGQTNYGMANSVMERICEKRMKEGLHGLAIQWGAIGDVGLVADMQEDNKELVIGGTLQQEISSCLNTLEAFLLQDRSIVGSMIVAEKRKSSGQATNPFEAVANIMGLKNPTMAAPNVSLAELGMDSMMAVEIKQTLEREFDILLTAQDIRNLTFAKLRKLTNTDKQKETKDDTEVYVNDLNGLKILTRKLNDSDLSPDIYVKLATKREAAGSEIFFIPGIDGSASVYKLIGSKIKSSAICLQHGILNMPNVTRSVMKSAAYLLPHVLEKIQSQKEFLIIGYSFGSLIAIELARLLEAKEFSGRLILIDGAPDQMKFVLEKHFYHTTEQELQNNILLQLMKLYLGSNNEMLTLELNKCNTWQEKLEFLSARFSKDINELTIENQILLCSTFYDHIIAIRDYNITSLPRLKSSIILLKSTLTPITFPEEDYGLHKITESAIQIHYVEGTHVTIIDNDEVVSLINEAL